MPYNGAVKLFNQHVFISGGGKRLGRALALRMLERGARLTMTYRHSREDALSLVEAAKKKGRSAEAHFLDLKKPETFQAFAQKTTEQFGPVTVLINCASDFYPTPLMKVNQADWRNFAQVNLESHFFLVQAFLKSMQTGVILNLVDINAEKPLRNFTPYVTAKAGLWMLTKNLALELAPRIRVNAISPGPVLLPEGFTDEQTARAKESTLLKRIGSAEDIVEAAVFLIENDYMTGVNLKVDGGASLN